MAAESAGLTVGVVRESFPGETRVALIEGFIIDRFRAVIFAVTVTFGMHGSVASNLGVMAGVVGRGVGHGEA